MRSGFWTIPTSELGPEAVAFTKRQRRGLVLSGTIAASPLVRVVPVARSVEQNGVAVELLAIEVREAGLRAWFRFAAISVGGPGAVRPGHPIVDVWDAAGTTCEAVAYVPTRHGSGGAAEIVAVPCPPAGVPTLTLTVTRFVAPPSPPAPAPQPPFDPSIEGPWIFEVSLEP